MARMMRMVLEGTGVRLIDLPAGLRVRETATERFWFNYTATSVEYRGRNLAAADLLRETLDTPL